MEESLLDGIKKHLFVDEEILWSGKSNEKKLLNPKDVILIPISTIFFMLSLLFVFLAIMMIIDPNEIKNKDASIGTGIALLLFGIPFMCFLFYLSIGRFKAKKIYKRNTIYAVTNKRVLVIKKSRKEEKVIEEYHNKIEKIDISLRKYGNGTLKFGEISGVKKFYSLGMVTEALLYPIDDIPIFYDIDDAVKVYKLVNSIKNNDYVS